MFSEPDVQPPPPHDPEVLRRRLLAVVALVLLALVAVARHDGGLGLAGIHGRGPGLDRSITGPSHPVRYPDGHHAFMLVQRGLAEPVGYNPCRSIGVEINYAGATPDILDRVQETIRSINAASGLHLEYVGASEQRRRTKALNGRVLVAFDDLPHDDALQDAAGVGGSWSYGTTPPGLTQYYVGGQITLNTAEFNHYPRRYQSLVLSHEFGHVLGLAHTEGSEVMAPGNYSVTRWGHGDLTALAILGDLPCR